MMKTLLFFLGACSLAFGQSLASDHKPATSKHFTAVELSSVSNYNQDNTDELIVTYEEKKLKKSICVLCRWKTIVKHPLKS